MPTYEYRCDGCGHELEIEQRITEPKLQICPKCTEAKLVRLIIGGNFILKGGGWYADLYHKPAGSKSETRSSDSSSSSSSESKPSESKSSESKSSESKSSESKSETKSAGASSAPASAPSTPSSSPSTPTGGKSS